MYDDRVEMERINSIMGNDEIELNEKLKYFYHMHPMYLATTCAFLTCALFTMLINEYERFNGGFKTVIDSIWYVMITVLTVGFGGISASTLLG